MEEGITDNSSAKGRLTSNSFAPPLPELLSSLNKSASDSTEQLPWEHRDSGSLHFLLCTGPVD